jgi:hypothetical protein
VADRPEVLLATLENPPWPYELVGVVEATHAGKPGDITGPPMDGLWTELRRQAHALGADAVIGIRLSRHRVGAREWSNRQQREHHFDRRLPSTTEFRERPEDRDDVLLVGAIGTAVRRLPARGSPDPSPSNR